MLGTQCHCGAPIAAPDHLFPGFSHAREKTINLFQLLLLFLLGLVLGWEGGGLGKAFYLQLNIILADTG